MNQDEIRIIEIFRNKKKKELPTSEIVKILYFEEFQKIKKNSESYFDNKDKEDAFKRKKAQLHRKTLYHINKLVENEILIVSRITGKNQKHFSLTIEDDEDIIFHNDKKRRIIISKPNIPGMPIEGFEQKNIIKKYEEATWISRVNNVMLQCKKIETLEKLKKIILNCFSHINDVVGVNDFETIIEQSGIDDIRKFLEELENESMDFGKIVSFTIDFTNIKDIKKIIQIIEIFSNLKPSHLNIIFDTTRKEFQKNEDLIIKTIELVSKSKIQIYFKNQDCHDAPYMLGKSGPYTYQEEDWANYREEFKNKITSIISGQSTISIDVEEFFKINKNSFEFRQLILNVAKSLLYANSIQRSRSAEYFKYFINLNEPNTTKLFSYSCHYIRFWNYGWKKSDEKSKNMMDLLKSTKEIINEFCTSEETIYKSCGMPNRFKIAFSCAFKDINKETFSQENFKKLQIRKLEDLYSPYVKQLLFEKEEIFDVFDGGDRLRFYRSGKINPKEVLREINIILNTYRIPFFCYDFGKIKGNDMSLTTFIEK